MAEAELAILDFSPNIPRTTILDVHANFLPIKMKHEAFEHCPQCVLRLVSQGSVKEVLNVPTNQSMETYLDRDIHPADVLIDVSCPSRPPKKTRTNPPQITVGGCVESQSGTGKRYYNAVAQG